mmetsp:Transcript_22468/g.89203  ORF Transcript_22468/g.89203 Transcript_22468/m.89203 type:complete len:241 (-) Transcript_22468:760-1482(-)
MQEDRAVRTRVEDGDAVLAAAVHAVPRDHPAAAGLDDRVAVRVALDKFERIERREALAARPERALGGAVIHRGRRHACRGAVGLRRPVRGDDDEARIARVIGSLGPRARVGEQRRALGRGVRRREPHVRDVAEEVPPHEVRRRGLGAGDGEGAVLTERRRERNVGVDREVPRRRVGPRRERRDGVLRVELHEPVAVLVRRCGDLGRAGHPEVVVARRREEDFRLRRVREPLEEPCGERAI